MLKATKSASAFNVFPQSPLPLRERGLFAALPGHVAILPVPRGGVPVAVFRLAESASAG